MDTKVTAIIGLAIAMILVASLIPTAITNVIGANQTNWGTSEKALWALIPTIAVIGVFLLILKVAGVLD